MNLFVLQEIVVARGSVLELLRPDPNTGKVHTLLSHEMFGVIRNVASFRLTGATKGALSSRVLSGKLASHADYIVLGSCSGRMVILEYDATKNAFTRVHQETFGKTGCRRIVPGQYLAIDTKGRAILTGPLFLFTDCFANCNMCRRLGETEASVHYEPRRAGASDHQLTVGGAQKSHGVLCSDKHRCRLREPHVRCA